MKLIKYISTAIVIAITFYSCKQDNYMVYDSDSFLQFGIIPEKEKLANPDDIQFGDSLNNYTFYYEPAEVTEEIAYFYLYTIGDVKNYDRKVAVKQIEKEGVNNAVAGTHYKPFEECNYVIPANKTYVKLPVTMYRSSDLKNSAVTLKFTVVDNEQFRVGEKKISWRELTFTDDLQRPNRWDASAVKYYYGEYSRTKHMWMIEVTGEKWDQEFMTEVGSAYDLQRYYIGMFNALLIDKNKKLQEQGLDVFKDENGNPIEFPS